MAIDEALRNEVEKWMREDPDPHTQSELERLLADGDEAELRDRFAGTLQFGTAGLRGILGAGPNRMNRAVVQRATAGLCAYVKEHVPDAAERGICIGFDGRRMSRELAEDVAAIVAGAGLEARTFDHVVATPVLAYACRDRGAAAGVIITASHNPPAYNGYKVYWENAAQIIPPQDEGIAARIAAAPAPAEIPRLEREQAVAEGLREVLGEDVERRYLEGIQQLLPAGPTDKDFGIAYTALHGVGTPFVRKALAQAGFAQVHEVAEQADPDAAFPTVDFPNPEEPGAMDLVLAVAQREGAELVLANDPDADRLAVAALDGQGRYRMLTGNEIGCLLAHYLLSQGEPTDDRLVISTVVSSPMLGAIARAHGVRWEQTLTGFKWIANRAMELEREAGARFVFGYEEALGYTVGTLVRDKDGIGAATAMAHMAAWCRARGQTLLGELESAWRRYGMYLSRQVSIVHEGQQGLARIRATMGNARARTPERVGDCRVLAVEDMKSGKRTARDGTESPLPLPSADVLLLELEGGHRVMLRPSGTEPKIKYYFDVCVELDERESVADAQKRGNQLIDEMVGSLREQVE